MDRVGEGVRRIAVFRALVLGDLLCAVPAWRALKASHPSARVTLVGLPWAAELARRLPCIDAFVAFPGFPGLPEQPCDTRALPGFLERLQAERFDLVLQMHGSGGIANPLVMCFGGRRTAGFFVPGAYCPDPQGFIPWPTQGHEIERLLSLTDALGWPRRGTALEFPVRDEDRRSLRALWPGAASSSYVIVHAGAQLRSRRWPVQRFARVADELARLGHAVVLTGTAAERPLVRQLREAMRQPAVDLSGRTGLFELGALVEAARLVVCNDTGISHVAAALGTPSVVVSSGGEVARWRPLDARRHRVLWRDVPCRPCAHDVCPSAHECALAVSTDAVVEAARDSLGEPAHAA